MKVAFVAAIFDVLHDGHLDLLHRMRAEGDLVVVVLHDDRSCFLLKGKVPMQSLRQRKHSLKVTGLADRVLTTKDTDPTAAFARILRSYAGNEFVYVRGDDVPEGFPGHWFLDAVGVPVKLKPYTLGVSSSAIRDDL